MKNTLLLTLFVCLNLVVFGQSNTPCAAGAVVAPAITVGAACSFQTGTTVGSTQQTNAANGGTPSCGSMGPDVWYSFTAPASGSIDITTQAGSITDGVMALYSGTCGSWTELACSDDDNGLMPTISQSGLTPGQTYLIRFWQYGGGTGTFDICVTSAAPPAGNTTCGVPSPICSGSPISFIANAGGAEAATINPGNNYDCLFTSPNPSWYYLEIDVSGNLVIDITAGSDVDYAIWGPFANLANAVANCNGYGLPTDCSYSSSAIEQAVVNGVVAGQVWVLLVTNYANTVQTININEAAANTASTNCAIVPLPVGFVHWDATFESDMTRLTWSTESEVNNDFFAVQHSIDGLVWETFDIVLGKGNSNQVNSYSSIHNSPKDGINYYRLMQVDKDGNFTFSTILSVNSKNIHTLTVYPNPTKGIVNVSKGDSDFEKVFLTDLIGTVMEIPYTDNQHEVTIDCSKIENGLYTLTVISVKGEKHSEHIVINK